MESPKIIDWGKSGTSDKMQGFVEVVIPMEGEKALGVVLNWELDPNNPEEWVFSAVDRLV